MQNTSTVRELARTPSASSTFRSAFSRRRLDTLLACLLGLGSFLLYVRTAAPSVAVLFDDTLEFQVVIPTLGIAHPSGYPLYTLLGKLFTLLVPWRDPAGRLNLLSAVAAALAVAVYYLAARHWVRSRVPALAAAVVLAVCPAWWAQATLAEVYALLGLFLASFLYCLARWEEATLTHQPSAGGWLVATACVTGLGMTHHRMLALWLPAALIFIVAIDPALLRQPRRWAGPLLAGLAPLLLYLYLPIRGQSVSSLDGTYMPTFQGTIDWILARAYSVFLTGNPFNVHRDAAFFSTLFQEQLGNLSLIAAGLGLLTAWRFGWRRYIFLALATLTSLAFGIAYKVADVEVFFLPAYLLVGLWAALGVMVVLDMVTGYLARAVRQGVPPPGARLYPLAPRVVLRGWTVLALAVLLISPVQSAIRSFRAQDRSQSWAAYDQGQDMLAQAAQGGEIVGLGGEISLVRYFRDVLGQRPDIQVVRADAEAERLAAVQAALERGRPVYLTRDLPGAAARYSLAAAGPLIQVRPRAQPAAALAGQTLGNGMTLVAAQTEVRQTHSGRVVRLKPVWSTALPVKEALKVSARLLDAAGEKLVQDDRVPVNFAYPTTAWVPGEAVPDVYDLAVPTGAPAGTYRPLLILYRASDGSEVGRVELPPVIL